MAIKYGFFNSVNGDRKYNADDISNYFVKLISDGVFATPATCMQVVEASGMYVNVSAGWAFLRCKWINNTTYESLSVEPSDLVLNRIDRVVLRLDPSVSSRNITIAVKKGTAAVTPEPPELTRVSDGIYELSLAQIAVNAGASAITQADITDERPDADVCGYVAGLIDQIDASNLFAQFESAFEQWFDVIKTTVKKTTIMYELVHEYQTSEEDEDEIPIGIPSYNYALDTLNVYVNGMKLVKDVDYMLTGTKDAILLIRDLDVIGTPVEFQVLKSVDTEDAEGIVSQFLSLTQEVQAIENRLGGLTFIKCSQAQYDQMPSHDPNTLYIISEGAS